MGQGALTVLCPTGGWNFFYSLVFVSYSSPRDLLERGAAGRTRSSVF